MTADQYLHGILLREAVDAGPNSPLLGVQATLMPTLRQWAGNNLLGVYPSGSFMKGTAVLSGTDIDLFLSLSEHTSETLKEVYNKLFDCLTMAGYSPKRQNVSLNITVSKYSVDLVPGSARTRFRPITACTDAKPTPGPKPTFLPMPERLLARDGQTRYAL